MTNYLQKLVNCKVDSYFHKSVRKSTKDFPPKIGKIGNVFINFQSVLYKHNQGVHCTGIK